MGEGGGEGKSGGKMRTTLEGRVQGECGQTNYAGERDNLQVFIGSRRLRSIMERRRSGRSWDVARGGEVMRGALGGVRWGMEGGV